MPLVWLTQVAPPSVVRRMVPELPTAVPVLASVKLTLLSVTVVPLVWLTQLAPPSVVRRMVPESPTAVPVLASVKLTSKSHSPVGSGFCRNHPSCGGSLIRAVGLESEKDEKAVNARIPMRSHRLRLTVVKKVNVILHYSLVFLSLQPVLPARPVTTKRFSWIRVRVRIGSQLAGQLTARTHMLISINVAKR